jgi:hypothetical protein
MGGDTASMIWWSKTQMRWAETQKLEHTGKDGAPLSQPALTEDHMRAIAEAILGR